MEPGDRTVIAPEPREERARLKIYSHLPPGRIPSDYEVATSRLLYHPRLGLEVVLPFGAEWKRHLHDSPLGCDDWEQFSDPRQTTYRAYVALMNERELLARQLFQRLHTDGDDGRLPGEAAELFETHLLTLRYPVHGLQMVAAYLGQLAPSGRITVACAFQAADEQRRIQHIAYRLALWRRHSPGLGGDNAAVWQRHPDWQPLRRVVEELLVTWDFGEAFVALQLCCKPMLDRFANVELAERTRALGDHRFAEILSSLDEDARWQRQWSAALVAMLLKARPQNRAWLNGAVARSAPPVYEAIGQLLGGAGDAAAARLVAWHRGWLGELGLEEGG
jgi:toluene monooxygenase system protein E